MILIVVFSPPHKWGGEKGVGSHWRNLSPNPSPLAERGTQDPPYSSDAFVIRLLCTAPVGCAAHQESAPSQMCRGALRQAQSVRGLLEDPRLCAGLQNSNASTNCRSGRHRLRQIGR